MTIFPRRKTFVEWRKEVDRTVQKRCGLRLDDLDDCNLMDWHEDGDTPSQAARRAIRYSGGDL